MPVTSAILIALALLFPPIVLAIITLAAWARSALKPRTVLGDVLWLAKHERRYGWKNLWRDRWAAPILALRLSGIPVGLEGDDKALLEQYREKRTELEAALETALTARDAERTEFDQRTATFAGMAAPTDEQRTAYTETRTAYASAETTFNEAHEARKAELLVIEQRIDAQELVERRRAEAASASRTTARVTGEPLTYRQDNAKEISYFADLAVASLPHIRAQVADPEKSLERLERHSKEVSIELPKREAAREARAMAQADEAEREFRGSFMQGVRAAGLETSPFERRVNPNTQDGQGGNFVPPFWMMDLIPALRASRTAANLCRQLVLPSGTNQINLPKLVTPTLTGIQATEGSGVASQDFTDTSVTANVRTIAGQEDVSLQLVEQSPGQIVDQAILEDLLADYDKQVDAQVLAGTNANGQIQGILPDTSWTANKITWTTATPLGPIFNMALGAMASKVSYNRYSLQNLHYLLHPRRWFWFATALDGASGTSGRPIVSANGFGPTNALAVHNGGGVPAEGFAGQVPFGPNAYIDGNLPIVATAAGAVTGGSNDLGLAAKWDDLWLFEGQLRTRVLPEVLSGTLQVRFQVYNYLAFLVRYGASIAVIVGTGMAGPTAAGDTSIVF